MVYQSFNSVSGRYLRLLPRKKDERSSDGQQWEKIKECLLLVCKECYQLLDTMLEFRKTMYRGAKNLLFLYKNVRSKPLRSKNLISSLEQKPESCHVLPEVIEAQSDKWLPVANEEEVQSDVCWADVVASNVMAKTEPVKLPPALPARIVNQGAAAVLVSEYNEDYAVLTPMNEVTNLQCIEVFVHSPELSETSKIEKFKEKNRAEFSVSDTRKVNKIKLNRQLFEAIRVTLKSPSLTEDFDIKYEPESESGSKSGPELAREWALELVREAAIDSERKSELESERKSEFESECKSELESERKSERKSESKSARDLQPDSESTLSCESDYEDPEHFPNIIFAKAFNGLADKETDLEQGEKAEDQIHCHLVTNPPSEWPCTGEQCRLQGLCEDEDPETPPASPRETPVVRSNTKNVVPGRPRCKLCGRSFAKISMLWQHFERSHMDATLKCSVCRKEFRNETELTFHNMKHQFKKTVEYQLEAPSRHACLECAVRCRGARTLRAHLATRTHAAKMQWRFQCDICKRKCPDRKRMAEHIQREHLAKEAVKCSMCPASFRSARTLRRHVAQHIVESQTQRNKPTDARTNGQPRKRTRGHENTDSDILGNGDTQTNEQARKTSTAGHRPPKSATITGPAPASSLPQPPGHQSTSTTKRPRKTTNNEMYAYTNRRRNTRADTSTKEQHTEIQTNGQTRKKTRNNTNKVNDTKRQGNTHASASPYINEHDDMDIQTKPTRKTTDKKVNNLTNRQTKAHTDTYINEQDVTEKQPNGQTRKKPGKASRNSQADTLADKQEVTNVKGQANAHKDTHTGMQETTRTAADTTHTHTNGRVQKRRKRRAYTTSKRARVMAKAAAARERGAVAKASLFDMLASFIL